MKYIIAGSRNFSDYALLSNQLNLIKPQISEIVCGEARGADLLGKQWGIANNIRIISFPAQWEVYGKSAGYIRNTKMGEYADCLIAF